MLLFLLHECCFSFSFILKDESVWHFHSLHLCHFEKHRLWLGRRLFSIFIPSYYPDILMHFTVHEGICIKNVYRNVKAELLQLMCFPPDHLE